MKITITMITKRDRALRRVFRALRIATHAICAGYELPACAGFEKLAQMSCNDVSLDRQDGTLRLRLSSQRRPRIGDLELDPSDSRILREHLEAVRGFGQNQPLWPSRRAEVALTVSGIRRIVHPTLTEEEPAT